MRHFTQLHNRQRGLSLIEALVYIVILLTLAVAIVGVVISLGTVFERSRAERSIADAASTALERLARDIRDADEVNLLLSTLNATSSVLVLENSATTTTYAVQSGTLTLNVEGTDLGALTSPHISVSNFSAVRYAGTGSDMVRIQLDLSATGRYATTTRSFTTAAVLRGSYEE